MEKYIKKYFQNDWFNWNWNFETCKKLLEPIKDNEFIEIFNNNYKKIMTSNNIDEKFNNKNFQAEKIKNIKNFFINARNYTSHYYHSHDKYIKSFKEISRFLTEITKPFVNNDEFNKLSEWEKSEIKIFLLIFIILNNKITYIYKPEWIESKYLKINTKSKFNKIDDSSEYNKILSNSISFLNSYFKSENNYWSNVKYNDLKIKTKKFEINFMNNILYNLLKYHKIQNIFSALDLNYEKHENYYKKISNRNFQNYFLYLKNDNLYKSFSLKTFFYYYIEYKIQNNNNQSLLEMSKEDFNSIIEKIKNSNKTNGIRKEQPKKDFEHLFTTKITVYSYVK